MFFSCCFYVTAELMFIGRGLSPVFSWDSFSKRHLSLGLSCHGAVVIPIARALVHVAAALACSALVPGALYLSLGLSCHGAVVIPIARALVHVAAALACSALVPGALAYAHQACAAFDPGCSCALLFIALDFEEEASFSTSCSCSATHLRCCRGADPRIQ